MFYPPMSLIHHIMWHPAKPLLENRVEFVHCIVIIMHCLHKTIFATPALFSKTPQLKSNIKPGAPDYFCFGRYRIAYGPFKTNKIYIIFSGGSRTGRFDPNDHPQVFLKTVHPD